MFCLLACLVFFLKTKYDVSLKQLKSVGILCDICVYLAGSVVMFTIYCRCRCQRSEFTPVSLFPSSCCLHLALYNHSCKGPELGSYFSCKSCFTQDPDWCGGNRWPWGEAFHNIIIESQSFSESVLLGCDLQRAAQFFGSSYRKQEDWRWPVLSASLLPQSLGSGKSQVTQALVK